MSAGTQRIGILPVRSWAVLQRSNGVLTSLVVNDGSAIIGLVMLSMMASGFAPCKFGAVCSLNINSSAARKRLEVFFPLQDRSCWGSVNCKNY